MPHACGPTPGDRRVPWTPCTRRSDPGCWPVSAAREALGGVTFTAPDRGRPTVPSGVETLRLSGAWQGLQRNHAPGPSSAVSSIRACSRAPCISRGQGSPCLLRKRPQPDLLPRREPGTGPGNCVSFRSPWLSSSFSSTHPLNPVTGPGGWMDSCLLPQETRVSREFSARVRANPWGTVWSRGPHAPGHLALGACLSPSARKGTDSVT